MSNDEYNTCKLESYISESTSILDRNGVRDDQIKCRYKRFNLRKLTTTFYINISRSLNADRELYEKKLKYFEIQVSFYSDKADYIACQTKLENNFNN